MDPLSTIELMKTPNGYSLSENDTLINKSAAIPHILQPARQSSIPKNPKSQRISSSTTSKKLNLMQQNFTIYPYIYTKESQNHRFMIIPSRSQWFNYNSVHEIERKELPQWFKQKRGVVPTLNQNKFQKNQDLYKKYRNYIINIAKLQYVSSTTARKGLAGDACAIIRIHKFLEKWGLINFVHQKPNANLSQNTQQYSQINFTPAKSHPKRKDGFDEDKTLLTKIYDKDDMELLKKITRKFRPLCDSCQSLCGISWYECTQKLTRKQFHDSQYQESSKVVHSGQIFEYQIKVCCSCFYEKNFPVMLSFDDFTKKSLLSVVKDVDFDERYGKKKNQQLTRLADTLEKSKFNIGRSSDQLKITEQELLGIYLQMPVQYLEKMSRVEPETEDETSIPSIGQQILKKETSTGGNHLQSCSSSVMDDEQLTAVKWQLQHLESQEKQIYEEFLQAWLLKMYAKLEELQKWDKSVQWRLHQNQTIKKYHLTQKIQQSWTKLQD